MLRNISKSLYQFYKLSTHHHNHQPPIKIHQPLHLQLLAKKITNQIANPKLQLLNQLLQTNTLQQYFNNKTIQDFTIQDIYFYITHRNKFIKPYNYKQIHSKIINNLILDCYSYFVFVKEMQLIYQQEYQINLLKSFNQGCMQLDKLQILYCLEILSKFGKQIREKYLNIQVVKLRIRQRQEQFGIQYLELLYYLKDICVISKIINIQTSKIYLHKLSEQLIKNNSHIKYFYYLQILSPIFNLSSSSTLPLTKQQLKKRQNLIQKKITTAKTDQQLKYCIQIIKFYYQFTYLIKIDKLNSNLYIQYLQFFNQQKKQNINFQMIYHTIPIHAIQTCKKNQFQKIIKLRVGLQLENQMELGKQVRKVIMYNLQAVYGLLRYINQNQEEQSKVWSDFQDMFLSKLTINNKNRDINKIFKQYDIITIWKILAYMNIHKLGSVKFWKCCHHLVYDVIMQQSIIKKITQKNQNNFLLYTFQIYQLRTIPELVQQKLVKFSLIALVNNRWRLWQLYLLVKSLAISKFGRHQIWYAMENKIMLLNIVKDLNGPNVIIWIKVYQYFKQMNIGSFKFYNKMKKYNIDQLELVRENQEKMDKELKEIQELQN